MVLRSSTINFWSGIVLIFILVLFNVRFCSCALSSSDASFLVNNVTTNGEDRVIGKTIPHESHPYLVSIRMASGVTAFCEGVLIDSTHVLTLASNAMQLHWMDSVVVVQDEEDKKNNENAILSAYVTPEIPPKSAWKGMNLAVIELLFPVPNTPVKMCEGIHTKVERSNFYHNGSAFFSVGLKASSLHVAETDRPLPEVFNYLELKITSYSDCLPNDEEEQSSEQEKKKEHHSRVAFCTYEKIRKRKRQKTIESNGKMEDVNKGGAILRTTKNSPPVLAGIYSKEVLLGSERRFEFMKTCTISASEFINAAKLKDCRSPPYQLCHQLFDLSYLNNIVY